MLTPDPWPGCCPVTARLRTPRRVSSAATARRLRFAHALLESLEPRVLLAATFYVDPSSPGPTHDGAAWATAYTDLQTALAAAVAGTQICVAHGTYSPTAGTDRTISFQLKSGVSLYGGYAGYGAPNTDARDTALYPTILSGDIGTLGYAADNTYHVLTANGVDATAVLDGVTITGGGAFGSSPNDCGAGMYLTNANPTLANCIFTANEADNLGAALYNSYSNPTLANCLFTANYAYDGGGGAIYDFHSNPVLTNCTFSGNSTYRYGGAICNVDSNPSLTQCTFSGRNAAELGGGMYNASASSPTLLNCTFEGNLLHICEGAAMYFVGSSATLVGCAFRGNLATAGNGGAIELKSSSNLTATDCTFFNNGADGAGAIECHSSSFNLFDCLFSNNGSSYVGGAMVITNSSSINVVNCLFSKNRAAYTGGAMEISNSTSVSFTNCTFVGNSADYPDYGKGGVVGSFSSSIDFTNCILWGNTASSSPEIYQSGGSVTVSYSDIQGGYTGPGNINVDPLFIRNPSASDSGDLRLQLSSPCIDAGNNAAPGLPATDLAGNPRFTNITGVPDTGAGTAPIVDMGAYEVQPFLYVDVNATGAHTGLSWSDAMTSLNAALTQAIAGITIRVADGTYIPTFSTDRTISFTLKNGVQILGGYAGYGAPDPDARDAGLYPTILSGDIGASGYAGDNSYHVLTATGVDATAVLDGFTITGANASESSSPNDCGGGMYLTNSNPTLTNCLFSANYAFNGGGGMYNYYSNPVLTNCTFSQNSAYRAGGAIYNAHSSPSLTNCAFSANIASEKGGAIYNASASSPTLLNCTFNSNISSGTGWGAGMYNAGSSTTLIGCAFSGNWSDAICLSSSSSLAAANCSFFENRGDEAGAIRCSASSLNLVDCLFSKNMTAFAGGALNILSSPSATLVNCTFANNAAIYGGGAANIQNSTSVSFINCTFAGNSGGHDGYGGALSSLNSSMNLTNCILWGNTASSNPQIYQSGGTVTVSYSDIQGGYTGTGNINVDPQFIRNPSASDSGDLRLRNTSPCIDAGNNAAPGLSTVTADLAGAPRFQDLPFISDTGAGTAPFIDMGPYESAPFYAYYHDSVFDGGPSVTTALAPNVLPLLPGQTASFTNYTSYSRGINGIVLDIPGTHGPFSAADFIFKLGNDNAPDAWTSAPDTLSILSYPLTSTATRIIISFPDNAIQNTWLQTTLKGGPDSTSGLPADLVFYFGSAPGDTGNNPASARVDMLDELTIRANYTASALITNPYDLNRDATVDPADETLARTHTTWFLSELHLIAPPALAAPAAPALSAAAETSELIIPDPGTASAAPAAILIDASTPVTLSPCHPVTVSPSSAPAATTTADSNYQLAVITPPLLNAKKAELEIRDSGLLLSRPPITIPMPSYHLPITKPRPRLTPRSAPLASRFTSFIDLKDLFISI